MSSTHDAAMAPSFKPRNRAEPWFLTGAGIVLLLTALAKILSAVGPARALDVPDPIIGISFRFVMVGVGLVELLIAFFCLFTARRWICLLAVAWLASNFVTYQLGLWWMGWHRPCGCLGNLTDALHISPTTADHIMKAVLAYLLIGSYWLLWRQWRRVTPASGTTQNTEGTAA
jgi:hypothetical protein